MACFGSHYTDLYLWNPSTRQCTEVLLLPSSGYGRAVYVVRNRLSASFGLCYDFSGDDYKAVTACYGKVELASFRRKKMGHHQLPLHERDEFWASNE